MGKIRKKIALIFSYNENWIGGSYYIQNIVSSLNQLDDSEKPLITICSEGDADFQYISKETSYPYLTFFDLTIKKNKITFYKDYINKFLSKRGKPELFAYSYNINYLNDDYDLVFPNPNSVHFRNIDLNKKVYWIPDFQEAYLPNLYTKKIITKIKQEQISIAINAKKIVFSSIDAMNDFKNLYPFSDAQLYTLPFAVSLPEMNNINIENILHKYNIPLKTYFFVANQFWKHKNHLVVLEAIKKLKRQNKDILILFSGKNSDYRGGNYYEEINEYIEKNNLYDNVRLLGFIPRDEQLILIKNSMALIQPSLFEGWSTSIEDAKALGKKVIASKLPVHIEQLPHNGLFFNPHSSDDLISCLEKIDDFTYINLNYDKSIESFSKKFINLIDL